MRTYGIDKTVIKGFTVINVDFDILNSKGNIDNVLCIRNNADKYNYFMDKPPDENFNIIKITDNIVFNTLKIDVKKVGNASFIKYGILELSIRGVEGDNFVPLNIKAYIIHVGKVIKYITERYGIMIDIREVKWEKVELNTTLTLNEPFKEYTRVFHTLMSIAPKTYRDYLRLGDKKTDESNYFLLRNNKMEIKIYNKEQQLEDVYCVDVKENVARLEYTLKGDKIKDVFGTNVIGEIEDIQIKEFIQQQFNKDFVNRYVKHKEESIKKLTRLAKEIKKDKKQWIKPYLLKVLDNEIKTEIPVLFDNVYFEEVLSKIDKLHLKRNIKRIEKILPISCQNQEQKLIEIFQKIGEL